MLSPVPAVMVSLGEGEEANIITIAWTGIINSRPPMTYVSIRKERHSHDILLKTREFVINLTTESLAKMTDWCGVKSGRDVDKAELFTLEEPGDNGVPGIKEYPLTLECKVLYSQDQDLESIPADIRAKFYPEGEDGADIHTAYVGLITDAYIIR